LGLWSIGLLEPWEEDLSKGNFRKVEEWANKIGVKTINIEIEKFDPFFNINTKEDFKKAKAMLEEEQND
jgi:molybdopterin-guanine dinucleotide biosynthesis protein A